MHQLQRGWPIQQHMAGLKHLAHATDTKQRFNHIIANLLPDHIGGIVRFRVCHARSSAGYLRRSQESGVRSAKCRNTRVSCTDQRTCPPAHIDSQCEHRHEYAHDELA